MLKISSTSDVPFLTLRQLATDLGPGVDVSVDERQTSLKAAEAPSWIELIAEADWWIKVFGAWAAVYFATIAKEAGTATWKATAELAKKLYWSTFKARQERGPATYLQYGLPVPDETYTTLLRSKALGEEDFLRELATFVHHLPALKEYLKEEGDKNDICGWISLEIMPNHHERRLAPDHESLGVSVQAVVGGHGADARSINVWWLDPVA
jgi:hypothetical protein